MPMGEQKVISIIRSECELVEERCVGYRENMLETIANILMDERLNRIQRIRIQQQINDKLNAAGNFLSENLKYFPKTGEEK